MATIFYPPANYVPSLEDVASSWMTLAEVCALANIACRASGGWTQRKVSWSHGSTWKITAEPGRIGAVNVIFPESEGRSVRNQARAVLLALAYGIFDGVARESVRGLAWSRNITPRGRRRSAAPKTNAERQREWRHRNAVIQSARAQ